MLLEIPITPPPIPHSHSIAFTEHMHIFPFSFASPETEGARRARRRSVLDCLDAIMREGNLNSRTTPSTKAPHAFEIAPRGTVIPRDTMIPITQRSCFMKML